MSEVWEAFQGYLTTVRANKRLRCPTPGIKLLVLHNLPKRLFWYEIRRTNSTKVDTHTVGINCEFAGKFTVHTAYSVLWATSLRISLFVDRKYSRYSQHADYALGGSNVL